MKPRYPRGLPLSLASLGNEKPPGPVKPLRGGTVCLDCINPTRCRIDKFCWRAEKQAITEERIERRQREAAKAWTRETVVAWFQRWVEEHGELPSRQLLEAPEYRRPPGSPSLSVVVRMFGNWTSAICAAGFQPRRRGWRKKAIAK